MRSAILALLALVALSSGACGKKGPLQPPPDSVEIEMPDRTETEDPAIPTF